MARDLQKKREKTRRWVRKAIDEGYGKWLYQKRKLIATNEAEFRKTLDEIQRIGGLEAAKMLAFKALRAAEEREKKLGTWTEKRAAKEARRANSPDPEKGKSDGQAKKEQAK